MKIVVASDAHGDRDILTRIIRQEIKTDIFLLCGDSELPEYLISPFVSVKGNCDYFEEYPTHRIIRTPYGNIYVEHGHLHSRIDKDFLKSKDCKIYLFGHTHCKFAKKEEEYYYFNPGSTSRPRDGGIGSYLVLNLSENEVKYEFKNV